jgi:hypothetical protein
MYKLAYRCLISTFPAATASGGRSSTVLRRIKIYLSSTERQDRMSLLFLSVENALVAEAKKPPAWRMWLLEDWQPSAEERNLISDDQNSWGKNFILDFSLLQVVACDQILLLLLLLLLLFIYLFSISGIILLTSTQNSKLLDTFCTRKCNFTHCTCTPFKGFKSRNTNVLANTIAVIQTYCFIYCRICLRVAYVNEM